MERLLESGGEPAVVQVHYDELGRLTGYTDPGGNRKVQHYDLLGRVLRVEDPNSEGDNLYQYDPVGNTIAVTDGRGITTESRYDGANRPAAKWDKDHPTDTLIQWHHDHAPDCPAEVCTNTEGLLAQVSYPGLDGERSVDTMGYDLRGRTWLKTRLLSGYTFRFEMDYDNADRLVATTYPNGRTIARAYDDANRLEAIDGVVDAIRYDERGLMAAMERSDGTTQTWQYDDLMRLERGRVIGQQGDLFQGMAYTRDRVGNILTIDDLTDFDGRSPRFGSAFIYDAWYRPTTADLERADGTMEMVHYQYDDLDNITSRRSSLGTDSAAHLGTMAYEGWGPHAVTTAGDQRFSYDLAGNMVTQEGRTMRWDYQGRLTHIHDSDHGRPLAHMSYASGEQRIAKREGDSTTLYTSPDFEVRDGITTLYIRAGRTRLARLQDDTLAPQLLDDYGGTHTAPDGQINAGDAWMAHIHTQQPRSTVGALLSSSARRMLMETAPPHVQLHHDHLGSITLATAQNHRLGQCRFDPHGQRNADSTFIDNYGFTGQEHDFSTSLIHFQWRYYNPILGRWNSMDPLFTIVNQKSIQSKEAFSPYTYVGNQFTTKVDPNGLSGQLPAKVQQSQDIRQKYNNKYTTISNQLLNRSITGKKPKSGIEVFRVLGNYEGPNKGNLNHIIAPYGDISNIHRDAIKAADRAIQQDRIDLGFTDSTKELTSIRP
ncbi:MAG: RHS repeat-associated core domain-containing protein, partial [Myxococcota bacterium]